MLTRHDDNLIRDYISSLIVQPSHFNSNKRHYAYGAATSVIEEMARECGVQRGIKDERLAVADMKAVGERLLANRDPDVSKAGSWLLQALPRQVAVNSPNSARNPPATPERALAENKHNTAAEFNPYAEHAGTGKCPTCRQPLPGNR